MIDVTLAAWFAGLPSAVAFSAAAWRRWVCGRKDGLCRVLAALSYLRLALAEAEPPVPHIDFWAPLSGEPVPAWLRAGVYGGRVVVHLPTESQPFSW